MIHKMKNIDQLEEALIQAEAEKEAAGLYWKNTGDNSKFDAAYKKILILQREIGQIQGEAFCEPLDFNLAWDIGAPLPHVVKNDYKTYLLFYLKTKESTVGCVEFIRTQKSKFGAPNDETLEGHPLFGNGLDYYEAFIVKNSDWIKSLEKINSVHSNHNSKYYKNYNHYFFAFHDSIFECVATGFKTEIIKGYMKDVVLEYTNKLFD